MYFVPFLSERRSKTIREPKGQMREMWKKRLGIASTETVVGRGLRSYCGVSSAQLDVRSTYLPKAQCGDD